MLRTLFRPALLLILAGCHTNQAEDTGMSGETRAKQEISTLLAHYKHLVEENKFDSMPALYEKEGVIRAGIGYSGFQSYDSLTREYASLPAKTKHFAWIDPRIDMLSSSAAVISATFEWVSDILPDTARSSYTGIVKKHGNVWLLSHEHETWDWPTAKKLAGMKQDEEKTSAPSQ